MTPLGGDRVLLITGGVGLAGPALLAMHHAVDLPQPVPAAVGILLLCIAPGLAIARVMGVEDPLIIVVVAIAGSLALDVIVSLVLFYTHMWSWLAGVGIVGGFTLLLAGLGLVWMPSPRGAIGTQTGISPDGRRVVGLTVSPPSAPPPVAQRRPTQNAGELRAASMLVPPGQVAQVVAAVAEARSRARAVGAATAATRAAFAHRDHGHNIAMEPMDRDGI